MAKNPQNPSAHARDAAATSLIPGLGRSAEEEMTTLSRILAWRIPGTEEPGGLPVMGSQSQTGLSDTHNSGGWKSEIKMLAGMHTSDLLEEGPSLSLPATGSTK